MTKVSGFGKQVQKQKGVIIKTFKAFHPLLQQHFEAVKSDVKSPGTEFLNFPFWSGCLATPVINTSMTAQPDGCLMEDRK